MRTRKIEFTGHAGDLLAARLDEPDGATLATALFAHCFTCSKDIPAARRIASRLASQGIAVLRFDFTGLGHSGGEFANTHFSSNVEDLVLAASHLATLGLAPALLIGHSLGGAAVLKAAERVASARAIVTIGAPSDPAHVTHHFADRMSSIEADGEAEVDLAGRPFRIRKAFLDDIRSTELLPAVGRLRRALLIMHSPVDKTVDVSNAAEIFMAARHPKSFVTLDDADHLMSNEADAGYAAGVLAAWAMRYLDLPTPEPHLDTPEGVVRTAEADPAGFRQDVTVGARHHLLADEPASVGGTDTGLTPYQFLSAGLGACTSMTIRMVARRRGWPLEHVSVDITHDKVHAADCHGCEAQHPPAPGSAPDAKAPRIDEFRRMIRLDGPLTDEQHRALIDIADRCPVHRTLEAGARVVTQAVDRLVEPAADAS